MAPEIRVYGKPDCQPCLMVRRHLDRARVPYRYLDVTTEPAALDEVALLGYQGVPVVVAGDVHRQGYRPDWLDVLVLAYSTAEDTGALEAAAVAELTDPDDQPCTRCGFHTSGLLDDDGVCPDCICAEDGAA